MKIALFLKHYKKQNQVDTNGDHAIVFDVEDNKVIGVENEDLKSKDISYLSLWAQMKKIKEIYIPEIDEQTRNIFIKFGINIKKYDELEDNKLFQTFII